MLWERKLAESQAEHDRKLEESANELTEARKATPSKGKEDKKSAEALGAAEANGCAWISANDEHRRRDLASKNTVTHKYALVLMKACYVVALFIMKIGK